MTRRTLVHVLSFAAFVSGCGGDDPSPRKADVPETPRFSFEGTPCKVPIPAGQDERVHCGVLTVPENWDAEGGRELRIQVAVLEATTDDPAPDAFLYLSGGPGLQALAAADAFQLFTSEFAAPIQSKRDLVFLDLRGTGSTEPSLDCPEIGEATIAGLANARREDETTLRDAAFAACRERLSAEGTDFTGYTSAQIVKDIDALRTSLGYAQWDLWGISYGTRIALTAMRDQPASVRSAILDSTVPLEWPDVTRSRDFERALHELSLACAANAKCGALTPDLEATLRELVPALDAAPLEVRIAGNPVAINGYRYVGFVQQAMYSTDLLPLVPAAIFEAAAGGTRTIELALDLRSLSGTSEGAYSAMLCQEKRPFVTEETLDEARQGVAPAFLGLGDVYGYGLVQAACESLHLAPRPAFEFEPVASDLPALILAGSMDPVTPPENGRNVAARLANGHYFEFPGFGHGVLRARSSETDSPRCAMRLVAAFLDDPDAAPDASCIATLPAVPF